MSISPEMSDTALEALAEHSGGVPGRINALLELAASPRGLYDCRKAGVGEHVKADAATWLREITRTVPQRGPESAKHHGFGISLLALLTVVGVGIFAINTIPGHWRLPLSAPSSDILQLPTTDGNRITSVTPIVSMPPRSPDHRDHTEPGTLSQARGSRQPVPAVVPLRSGDKTNSMQMQTGTPAIAAWQEVLPRLGTGPAGLVSLARESAGVVAVSAARWAGLFPSLLGEIRIHSGSDAALFASTAPKGAPTPTSPSTVITLGATVSTAASAATPQSTSAPIAARPPSPTTPLKGLAEPQHIISMAAVLPAPLRNSARMRPPSDHSLAVTPPQTDVTGSQSHPSAAFLTRLSMTVTALGPTVAGSAPNISGVRQTSLPGVRLRQADRAGATSEAPRRPAPVGRAIDREYIDRLIKGGDAMLVRGNVDAARAFFERAAVDRSAAAATRLGKTYDPSFLQEINAGGVKPDPSTAATWYHRGSALGDQEARDRLSALKGD